MAGIIDQQALIGGRIGRQIPQLVNDFFPGRPTVQEKIDLESVFTTQEARHFARIVNGSFEGRDLLVLVIVYADHQRPECTQLPAFVAQIISALYLQSSLSLNLIRKQKETSEGETGYRELQP